MANYAICILVLNKYNPILNINAVICMKRHTKYWSPLHYTIFRVLNFSITHGNRRFKYQTLISCNKNAVYRGITQTLLLETFFQTWLMDYMFNCYSRRSLVYQYTIFPNPFTLQHKWSWCRSKSQLWSIVGSYVIKLNNKT